MPLSRREWLQSTALGLLPATAAAIGPITRHGPPAMRLSLAAYSWRGVLDLKLKPTPPKTLFDFIDYAATQPLDAVELTGYYFPETSPEYLAKVKAKCTTLGLDVSGSAVGNDFCVTDPGKLKEQLELVKRWTEATARLGGKSLRIFAGKVAKGDDEAKAVARCIPVIQEACEYAAKWGVYMALENHGGITATAEQLLKLVKAVDHPFFGVNLDSGNFRTPDPYGDLEKLAPYAVTVQIKTEMFPMGKPSEEADLPRLIAMLRKVGYRGYVALEYEAKDDPSVAIPKYLTSLRKILSEPAK